MKNNKLRKLLPPLISLIVAIACGIGMIYLYKLTKYLPIYLLGLTLLLPSAVNLSLFILKIPTKKKEKKAEITEESPEPASEEKKFKKLLRAVGKAIKNFFSKICGKIDAEKVIRYLSIILAAAAFVAIQYFFAISLKAATSLYTVNYAYAVLMIALFLVFIVLDKWMLHNEDAGEYASALGSNVRSILALARLALILMIPAMFIKLLGFYELQKYVVAKQKAALKASDLDAFFAEVIASGRSSFCYLQNVYTTKNLTEQGLSLALCLADGYLSGKRAAFRVHGGGFAGTIQAFIHESDVEGFRAIMDSVFGEGKCIVLRIRPEGAVRIA